MARRVVITGMGAITSLGKTVEQFWNGLIEGRSGIGLIKLFDTSRYKTKFGGELSDFDPEEYFDTREAKRLDRFAQFAMIAASEAVQDSGIDFEQTDRWKVGVIIGSGIGGLNEIETQHVRLMEAGPSKISPFMIPKLMVNAASGQISIKWGLRGPNSAVATACASASNAIGDAFKMIQSGHTNVMISGGTEAAMTPMGVSGFIQLRALSERNDAPAKASRPFEKDRDGFVLAEGAGIVVLEEEQHARRRGARIYAELLGYGTSADGLHITAPDPVGTGAARAMADCLADARLNPVDVAYINAHGTSTELGDAAETKALKAVFGPHALKVAVSSTKSSTGHLLGASGGVELIASTLAIHRGVIPPTINYDTPDPACDLDYVPNVAREMPVRHALSNSFGFGGHNACLIVGRYEGKNDK